MDFLSLFDGHSTAGWSMVGGGGFRVVDGALESENDSAELGLLWSHHPTPPDFTLRLDWRAFAADANSGVFVRFPDPGSKNYDNPAWVGVHFGFEIQIDDLGAPDGAALHRTGAIYNEPDQVLSLQPTRPLGQWNTFEIVVVGQTYTVTLDGVQTTTFINPHAGRGLPSTDETPSYVGIQAYPGQRVQFRNIRIR